MEEFVIERYTGVEFHGPPTYSSEKVTTFRQVVRASPYILTNENNRMVQAAAKWIWDQILRVFLPFLGNLRLLSTPVGCWGGSKSLLRDSHIAYSVIYPALFPTECRANRRQRVQCLLPHRLCKRAPFLALRSVQSLLLECCAVTIFRVTFIAPKVPC